MSFPGPFAAGHVVTASEWNDAQSAHLAVDTRVGTVEGTVVQAATWLPLSTSGVARHSGPDRVFRGTATLPPSLINGNALAEVSGAVVANEYVDVALDVVNGIKITTLAVRIAAANYTGLPGTRATIKLYKYDDSSDTATQVGAAGTDAVVLATYNTIHAFGVTLNETIGDYRYFARFGFGNGGTNSGTPSVELLDVAYGIASIV